jgi:SAM-dependent methyltransferase
MLTRLFLLLAEVDVVSADQALAPLGVEGLERLRLVETLDGRVRATVRIVPHGRLVLASDLPGLVGAEHVAGIHGPSATLGHLTVRRPVARALDVATGSGIQALLAARHAERVVATDVNERALAFAAFNVAVNGVDNVELRHGSFFEPVLGERFGLVVCNPPRSTRRPTTPSRLRQAGTATRRRPTSTASASTGGSTTTGARASRRSRTARS